MKDDINWNSWNPNIDPRDILMSGFKKLYGYNGVPTSTLLWKGFTSGTNYGHGGGGRIDGANGGRVGWIDKRTGQIHQSG